MRIIAGKHCKKKLAAFRGDAIRPTPDRVKESLFQILSARLADARVLDLFAGSGALGIECLSRGAREIVFNDSSRESLEIVKKNLTLVGERAEVVCSDYESCLKRQVGKFDLVFCDPPYKEEYLKKILLLVKERELLNEGGLVIYESEREQEGIEGFSLADKRRYGRTIVGMWKRV